MNSIRGRILLPLAIFMVVLPVCTYVSFGVVTRRYMREMAYEDLTSSLSATRVIVENVYGEYGDSGVDLTEDQKRERAKEILLRTRQALRQGQNQVAASIIVLNRGYNMLFPSEPDQEAAAIAAYFNDRKDVQRLDEDPPVFEEIHTQGKNYIACQLRITDPDKVLSNYLIVYSSIDSADSLLSLAAQFTLGITALLSLAALVVAWLAATSIAAPIRRLCIGGSLLPCGQGMHGHTTTVYYTTKAGKCTSRGPFFTPGPSLIRLRASHLIPSGRRAPRRIRTAGALDAVSSGIPSSATLPPQSKIRTDSTVPSEKGIQHHG